MLLSLPDCHSIFDLDQLDYCNEGNRTIVISHRSLCWILRIPKATRPPEHRVKVTNLSASAELTRTPSVTKYFGPEFTRQMHLFNAPAHFLKRLEKKINAHRPPHRKCKSMQHNSPFIIIAPDAAKIPPTLSPYTFGPTISVEIKPKFGAFLLWPGTGSTSLAKQCASLFCLRQNHTGKLSQWTSPSFYCPCDLFSGDLPRMIQSLKALRKSPQINLRIYLDGELLFSHEYDDLKRGLAYFFHPQGTAFNSTSTTTDANSTRPLSPLRLPRNCANPDCCFPNDQDRLFSGILPQALLHKFDNCSPPILPSIASKFGLTYSMDCQLHKTKFCNGLRSNGRISKITESSPDYCGQSNYQCLPSMHSILGRVLATQLLSQDDISYVDSHYDRVVHFLSKYDLNWETYLQLSPKERLQLPLGAAGLSESFDVVERYLISLVARDCSIMITMQRVTSNYPDRTPVIGGWCSCLPPMLLNASIVDLDPKPLEKIHGRYGVEESIVQQALHRHPNLLTTAFLVL